LSPAQAELDDSSFDRRCFVGEAGVHNGFRLLILLVLKISGVFGMKKNLEEFEDAEVY
jgi:hypothetical protein